MNESRVMSLFQKILPLLHHSESSYIFPGLQEEDYFVIMPLNVYQKLLHAPVRLGSEVPLSTDLTEQNLLDKINRDLALWNESNQEEKLSRLRHLMEAEQTSEKPTSPVSSVSASVITNESLKLNSSVGERSDVQERYYFEPQDEDETLETVVSGV